jgi:hypothetical protein
VQQILDVYQPRRLRLALPMIATLGLAAAWWLDRRRPALLLGSLVFVSLLAHLALDGPVARYRYLTEPLLTVLALLPIWAVLHVLYPPIHPNPTPACRCPRESPS